MRSRVYDMVFVGGGLAALLLLRELRRMLPERVAVVDPAPLLERPTVHWSYWSREPTLYDRFAIGVWRRARVAGAPPESIAPLTLRLVRSGDIFERIAGMLAPAPIDWLPAPARSISHRSDDLYEVVTDAGTLRARWVFDSVVELAPAFPTPDRPRAVLSGTGLRVTADRPVFDAESATLLDPLDERSFAYLLPLSPVEALLESAAFGPVIQREDPGPLLHYLRARHTDVRFAVAHVEHGSIPLGFAPSRTAGPRHVLLGTKAGLVKPSAGYGLVRIARESASLARLWRRGRPLPASRRAPWTYRLLDTGFLQLAAQEPARPLALVNRVMQAVPLAQSLRFIDEELSAPELAAIVRSAAPVVLARE